MSDERRREEKTEEEREKNKAGRTVGQKERWTERDARGRGEMQIQVEPKREMRR